jgi:glycosyltransferase involved in cell wall biosynthesis
MVNEKIIVSIIIPTRNRKNFLKEALCNLEKQTLDKNLFEVIVVNDVSNDGTEQMLKQISESLHFRLRVFKNARHNLQEARNLGIKYAQAELIALHDDDVMVESEWLQKALPYFKDETVSAVEGKIQINSKLTAFTRATINLSGNMFAAGNMFYRKSILMQLNGFDATFTFPFCGDCDMGLRILAMGGKIAFAENVIAYHAIHQITSAGILKRALLYQMLPYLFKKHGEKIKLLYLGFRITNIYVTIFFLIFIYAILMSNLLAVVGSLVCMVSVTVDADEKHLSFTRPWELFKALPFFVAKDILSVAMFFYGCVKYRVMPNAKTFRR